MSRAIRLLAGLGMVLLTACTAGPSVPPTGAGAGAAGPEGAAAEQPLAQRDDGNYPVRSFPTQTLSALLAAELAGVRGDVVFALAQYREQARTTGDPGVIARAAHIAQYAGDEAAAAELAKLWVAKEPDNPQAQELVTAGLLREGELLAALPHAAFLLRQGDGQALRQITAEAAKRPGEQRRELLAAYQKLLVEEPDNADVLFGNALLLWEERRGEEARELAEQALRARPDEPAGHLLYAQLLDESGAREEALDHLEKTLREHAGNTNFSRAYVRLLFTRNDVALALTRLSPLVERYPDDSALRFGLALAYRESAQLTPAREQFERLLEDPEFGDDARFHLAQVHESEGDANGAMALYRSVQKGYWLPATARLTHLLADAGDLPAARRHLEEARAQRPDNEVALYQIEAELLMRADAPREARDFLSAGLAANPGSIELLYARSLAHEKLGDIAAVETDLRAILAVDAKNASALNALGYSLANHTDRLDEAQALIERALALEPDDGAVIDSLGWVLYRRGEHHRALAELQRAAAMMPDPEVAAHLGEVLWVMGERERARSIWGEALKQFPEDRLIRETMHRLQADS